MSGLFLGRSSACNWCEDGSSESSQSSVSSSESVSSSSVSGSSESSSSLETVTVCNRCVDLISPARYKVTIGSASVCPAFYVNTFILPVQTGFCVWRSDEIAHRSDTCVPFSTDRAVVLNFFLSGSDILIHLQIQHWAPGLFGLAKRLSTYWELFAPTENTAENGPRIDCIDSWTLPVRSNTGGFPTQLTISPA
jgi:hypothetical protein